MSRSFEDRHIGPTSHDENAMLKELGYSDLNSFISLPKRNEHSPCPQKRWKSATEALQLALLLELVTVN